MPTIDPEADRPVWEIGLAAIREQLGSEPIENLGDLLRMGEKALAAAGLDVGARLDAMADAPDTRFVRRTRKRANSRRATLLRLQGAYYVLSGLWAVADRRGFESLTGRKTDYWLVRTVGLLAAAIGLSLLAGARGGRPSSETTVLAVGAGVSFTAVDLSYVARRRISPVYLGDATLHGLLAGFALLGSREPS